MAWLGQTDLDASVDEARVGRGPIAGAVEDRDFDRVLLLNTYPATSRPPATRPGLGARNDAAPALEIAPSNSPARSTTRPSTRRRSTPSSRCARSTAPRLELTFHLSPGTPAMAAVWLLLAKARYDAQLIDSSREHGVRDVEVPFEISMEYIPEILRASDRRIAGLAASTPPDRP